MVMAPRRSFESQRRGGKGNESEGLGSFVHLWTFLEKEQGKGASFKRGFWMDQTRDILSMNIESPEQKFGLIRLGTNFL